MVYFYSPFKFAQKIQRKKYGLESYKWKTIYKNCIFPYYYIDSKGPIVLESEEPSQKGGDEVAVVVSRRKTSLTKAVR